MTRAQLIQLMAKHFPNQSELRTQKTLRILLDCLCLSLSKGQRIEVRDFGSFTLRYHPARRVVHPITKKEILATSSYRPHFKPGLALREQVNQAAKAGVLIK